MQTQFVVIGINHKKAPVEVREKFSLSDTHQDLLLSELKNRPDVVEAFVLSTCNRVEIYANVIADINAPLLFIELLCSIKKIPFSESIKDYFYIETGEAAVRHLFYVTTGLDSMVLGEKQILGQVKSAVARAQDKAMFQPYFNILSNLAIRAGKKVQTETEISYGGSSVGWAAGVLAERILGTLTGKSVLVIGAGKMSALTIKQMCARPLQKIYLMNRTHEKAESLADECGATVVSMYDLREIIQDVDVCISSVAAPHYIIEKEMLQKVMPLRQNRKLLLVDIAVPRNMDPAVADLIDVELCTIDDLDKMIDETLQRRQSAVPQVQRIIDEKLTDFHDKMTRIANLAAPAIDGEADLIPR